MTPEEALQCLYRQAAKAAHPDTQGGSHEAFVAVQQALETLKRTMEQAGGFQAGGIRMPRPAATEEDTWTLFSPIRPPSWAFYLEQWEATVKKCAWCGDLYAPITIRPGPPPLYCSPACRDAATRAGRMQRRALDRVCAVCGKRFSTHRPRARYCSDACRLIAWRAHHQPPTPSDQHHRRDHRTKRATCRVCGRRFAAARPDARYCSAACTQKAYRQRRKQAADRAAPP